MKYESPEELIDAIQFKLKKNASTGEVAQFKRHRIEDCPVPAFYRLVMPALAEYKYYPAANEEKAMKFEKKLMAILAGIADDISIHSSQTPLGRALFRAGFPELRFYRLLKATDDQLLKQIRYMCKYLSSKGVSANLAEAFKLTADDSAKFYEIIRRQISRDYYRSQSENSSKEEIQQ